MDFIYSFLVVAHFIGLAAIIGPFLVQMRKNSDFAIAAVLGGAITQLVTGVALTGIARANIEDYTVIFIKLAISIVVLTAALLGWRKAKKNGNDRAIKPFFHAAGGLAIVNVILAVFA
jgi:Ca2+/Na+ antiporter